MNDATRELAAAVATLRDGDEALRFLRDLCTVNELREFAARWEVARLLEKPTSGAAHKATKRALVRLAEEMARGK